MRPLTLKKKESRQVWQLLLRGIVATDKMAAKATSEEREAYLAVRERILSSWKAGIVLGGVRPKKEIYTLMPPQLRQAMELKKLKKSSRRDLAASRQAIAVPRHTNSNSSAALPRSRQVQVKSGDGDRDDR
jgi:hypothetical protein